ncbi:PA14 domain-containing protein [Chitinophaga barathri]|uniref:PA14 domain-containing protein n=1 Tax=Chitinophaga barathri TaxID=1647451 RepID=A0A3N4MRS9_9BACT|nr:PA14 domain-containing protein [Chitinophaga barathri]RPD38063.1 hypothetical protein EG028_26995 [Chitinophaga barathri]
MMILALANGRKKIAWSMLTLLYLETAVPAHAALPASGRAFREKAKTAAHLPPAAVVPPAPPAAPAAAKKTFNGGPTQPETQGFASVNSENMVDLFTGDFSYNIPLVDVGGYPVAMGYSSGASMDQEAAWCGLGWNINPGSITRNMRGIPDDFNGQDTIAKTARVKMNKTIGATTGAGIEIAGFPKGASGGGGVQDSINIRLGVNLGIFHNTYRGWGLEAGINPSINAGGVAGGSLSGGLSITSNSQEGLTLSPSLSFALARQDADGSGGFGGNVSIGTAYNSRSGMKSFQFSGGVRQFKAASKIKEEVKKIQDSKETSLRMLDNGSSGVFSSGMSFAFPSYTPTISMPFTNSMYTAMVKVGIEYKSIDPNFYVGGYITKQFIEDADTTRYLPAYGYLHYQDGANNPAALLDYNREREIAYRDKPEFPNIAVPVYTHDVFTMSGEGTGGTFRAYRSDVGFVFDHQMRTKDKSLTGNVDLGFGDLVHVGVDVSVTKAFTETSAWRSANPLASAIPFTRSTGKYQAAYFRNPGEKTVNTTAFYDNIGGDDVVFAKLNQPNRVLPSITTTNKLVRFRGGKKIAEVNILPGQAIKKTRDKRTQVISYLTAEEASTAGFPKYIENYGLNQFVAAGCDEGFPADTDGEGVGWFGEYYKKQFEQLMFSRVDKTVDFADIQEYFRRQDRDYQYMGNNESTVRWTGRIKAPVTGTYRVSMWADDGVQLAVNNKWVLETFPGENNGDYERVCFLNLEAGEVYDILLEYVNRNTRGANFRMVWKCGETQLSWKDMYLMPVTDTFEVVKDKLYKEKRVNAFRKKNHISQIDVLNSNGRRYVYGIPVYNLKQKEVTFAARKENGDPLNDTVKYVHGVDNTAIENRNGIDNYFSSETTPAYAHTFLLSGVLSPDYVDATGDGISDDDPGDAVKFNYTKVAGVKNPFKWRTPNGYAASYHQGLKSDSRDEKGSYVYGEKELWYLNSIESKTMIATFKLEDRNDLYSVKENGEPELNLRAKKLTEINLYSKAEYLKRGKNARPIKTVHFEYEDELCPDNTYSGMPRAKLTLKSVYFSYNGNKKGRKNAYRFHYHANNPSYNAKSYDRWGNYKDPMSNPGSVSGKVVTNADYPYALQDSATAAYNAAAWALDSIVLPSGGRMKIKYESDDYAFVQNKRAAQMFRVAGFSATQPASKAGLSNRLYSNSGDHLYVAIDVPSSVTSKNEVWEKYLEGIVDMNFRLSVLMPGDKWGSGHEFVSGYTKLEGDQYGFINGGNTIWVKMATVSKNGLENGPYSPMAKTAVQFLRLNLPSKAFRGSDVGDDIDLKDGVQMIAGMADNIVNAFRSFDESARKQHWAQEVDLTRAYVRLHSPDYKKLGGGHRVKQILIYDNWKAMTGQKESIYGTEYTYTTTRNVHGKNIVISSGVAAYEPIIGGEENPWKEPIQYREQIASLAPTTMGYVEMPLGESFFPAPTVGYSNVKARSVRTAKTRSATGYVETGFYTAYDFPVIVEHSLLDPGTKLSYNPKLTNLLQVNVMRHLVISQGFKVELNDMHGQLKYRKTYGETDSLIASTTYHYRLDEGAAEFKHLSNTVPAMGADGQIDAQTMIGKDMELMMDMRQQLSVSHAIDFNVNGDIFTFGIPPILGYPSFWAFPHRQENLFRSVAATKVIYRHGIMDSIVATDKGSRVSTRNLLFDAETGDAILTATQNEHDDPVYNFNYPAGWIYDGMSGAYKNIGTMLENVEFREGRLITSLGTDSVSGYFASGDEILMYSQNNISANGCDPVVATFRSASVIWAVDANALTGGPANIFFLDKNGKPFSGSGANLKVIRSGRKNISATAGTVTMLENPLKKNGSGQYYLQIDENSRIINAQMTEFKQNWQVEDKKKEKIICLF